MSRWPLSLLQCTVCHGVLEAHTDVVRCTQCHARYSMTNGVVSFVSSTHAHPDTNAPDSFLINVKNTFKRFPRLYQMLIAVFGASSGGVTPERFLRNYAQSHSTIVNLGSGSGERYGEAIHVDLFPFQGVDIVADICHLPFRDGSVDAVLCLAVLEHVPYPQQVLAEIKRVLRPGGCSYFTTPFMQPYHSSPHDYQRWTLDGLRILTTGLEEVQTGVRHGPTSAMTLMLAHWFATVLSAGSSHVFNALLIIGMAILMPIAHVIDLPLNKLRISETVASGYYYIARKPL